MLDPRQRSTTFCRKRALDEKRKSSTVVWTICHGNYLPIGRSLERSAFGMPSNHGPQSTFRPDHVTRDEVGFRTNIFFKCVTSMSILKIRTQSKRISRDFSSSCDFQTDQLRRTLQRRLFEMRFTVEGYELKSRVRKFHVENRIEIHHAASVLERFPGLDVLQTKLSISFRSIRYVSLDRSTSLFGEVFSG